MSTLVFITRKRRRVLANSRNSNKIEIKIYQNKITLYSNYVSQFSITLKRHKLKIKRSLSILTNLFKLKTLISQTPITSNLKPS